MKATLEFNLPVDELERSANSLIKAVESKIIFTDDKPK